jgi:hypothetical protein
VQCVNRNSSGKGRVLTRRSSRLPRAGPELLDDSLLLDSDGFGFGVSLGSDFFSCGGGGGGLDSSLGFDSSFFDGSGSDDVGCSFGAGSLASEDASSFPPPDGAPPSSRRTRSCPTVTVSSSFARYSFMVPASGALTATSIYKLHC